MYFYHKHALLGSGGWEMNLPLAIEVWTRLNFNKFGNIYAYKPEAVFLVVCDPSMNELWAT